jgi:Peptidase family M28
MVGEDTVKTGSRFYFTKMPDSVPSYLDGLMSDVLEQTRQADLYAQTGTRNYWVPEAIPYAQGSDHDVFLGLGIPATMLGHDPDWTHHTSEDKIDKTDATEFRRVGVFASTAAYWIAAAQQSEWNQISAAESASRIMELTRRLASDATMPSTVVARRIKVNREEFDKQNVWLAWELDLLAGGKKTLTRTENAHVTIPSPRRQALLPLDASVFENASPEDRKWLAEQEARFASDSAGLATKPNFALLSFEALNFMDGFHDSGRIADLLAAEFLVDIDKAWVNRLTNILEKQKLISTEKNGGTYP